MVRPRGIKTPGLRRCQRTFGAGPATPSASVKVAAFKPWLCSASSKKKGLCPMNPTALCVKALRHARKSGCWLEFAGSYQLPGGTCGLPVLRSVAAAEAGASSSFARRNNSALPITVTSESAMAAAAINGFKRPNAASGIASTL
jgi:hypothetical protein